MLAAGEIDAKEFIELVASSAPSTGYCNTMGTATTMNSLAEALGMQLPGSASIPAPYRERQQMAYETGLRIVEMVWENLGQYGDRRLNQCADPPCSDRAPLRRRP
jgi:dihydroxy-acid dehydratase